MTFVNVGRFGVKPGRRDRLIEILTRPIGELHDHGRAVALRLLGPGPGRLLDLGCGTGAHTAAFRDQEWDVTGVDASEDMLRRARDRGLDVGRGLARRDGHACLREQLFSLVFE